MSDKMVEFQSKILQSVLKAFKIEPTVPGLIQGMGGDPEQVFELVRFVQANGVRLTQTFEAAVTGTAQRVERMERQQDEMHAMLVALCRNESIAVVHANAPPRLAQVTVNAVLDEASGRS